MVKVWGEAAVPTAGGIAAFGGTEMPVPTGNPPAARRKRGRYRQAVQLSDHFLPAFLSILAFFANLRKRFAYFDCFARFSKKFLLQK